MANTVPRYKAEKLSTLRINFKGEIEIEEFRVLQGMPPGFKVDLNEGVWMCTLEGDTKPTEFPLGKMNEDIPLVPGAVVGVYDFSLPEHRELAKGHKSIIEGLYNTRK